MSLCLGLPIFLSCLLPAYCLFPDVFSWLLSFFSLALDDKIQEKFVWLKVSLKGQ